MLIRSRTDDDLGPLCDLVRLVHASDGYPVVLQDDVLSFLVAANSLTDWVAEDGGGAVTGHVSLYNVSSDAVARLACSALGCDQSQLGAGWTRLGTTSLVMSNAPIAEHVYALVSGAADAGTPPWPPC